jgi:hypothetical protein
MSTRVLELVMIAGETPMGVIQFSDVLITMSSPTFDDKHVLSPVFGIISTSKPSAAVSLSNHTDKSGIFDSVLYTFSTTMASVAA